MYDGKTQYYREAKRDIDHSYWNALITLNGILISVFTAFSFFTEFRLLTSLIVILSIWACWLMIENFRLSQKVFDKLGGLNFPTDKISDDLTKEEKDKVWAELIEFRNKNLNPNDSRSKITANEKIVTTLFWLQMCFIIIFLLIILIKGQPVPS